jgi:hypothetical protein
MRGKGASEEGKGLEVGKWESPKSSFKPGFPGLGT